MQKEGQEGPKAPHDGDASNVGSQGPIKHLAPFIVVLSLLWGHNNIILIYLNLV
jgi:preprotein translocase subunit SecG